MEASCFFVPPLLLRHRKKPESRLSGFQLEQQINLRIFDDFCRKNQSIQVQFQMKYFSL